MHVHLEKSALIAKGGHRSCYQHPDEQARCIKVLHEPWQTIERRLNDPLRAIRRRRNYDENLSEWIELKKLESKLGKDHSLHFPRAYELVETNLGDGLVADLICDFDGSLSHTLKSYLWEHAAVTPECATAIDEFWTFLKDRKLIVRDPFPHNLMVQRVNAEGQLRILLIDGFGSSDFLPFSKIISSLRNRKLDGRRKRMQRQIDKHLKEIAQGDALKGKGAAV